MRFTDPDGMWPDGGITDFISDLGDFTTGVAHSYLSDVTTGNLSPAFHHNDGAYGFGQKVGHIAAAVQGVSEMISGGGAATVGIVGAPETGGLSLAVSAAGAGEFLHGANTIKNAFVNSVSEAKSSSSGESKEPNGNSLSSQKEQHGYSIRDKETHEVKEFGISGQKAKRDATGVFKSSPRIAQKLRTKYKGDKGVYGQFEAWLKNRADAVQWEKDQVQEFKDANDGAKPTRQIRP
jgi:hypothetical protein